MLESTRHFNFETKLLCNKIRNNHQQNVPNRHAHNRFLWSNRPSRLFLSSAFFSVKRPNDVQKFMQNSSTARVIDIIQTWQFSSIWKLSAQRNETETRQFNATRIGCSGWTLEAELPRDGRDSDVRRSRDLPVVFWRVFLLPWRGAAPGLALIQRLAFVEPRSIDRRRG